jgi:hypothetical protein
VRLESQVLKKALILISFLLPACLTGLSCGGYTAPSSSQTGSGLKYRAFVTNGVSAGTASAGIYIVNAATDVHANAAPIAAGNTPGMMVVTPNRTTTLVFSGSGTQSSDNVLSLISNGSESNAAHVNLPGTTESFVVSPDSSTAYIAVPTAPANGQSPGVIDVLSLGSGTISGEISCPPGNPIPPVCVSADANLQGFNPPFRYLSIGNTGTRLLGFSEGSGQTFDSVANVVAVITPSSLGTASPLVTFVPGFDHPVAAFFNSDDTIAYVVNCGAECGGTQASVQQLNLTDNTLGPSVAVCSPGTTQCAASVALVTGSTMYLAGTPYTNGVPAQPCTGQMTAATTCGLLTIVDLSQMAVVNSTPIIITDGYHNRMALAANGQLFIGARTCTEITAPIPPPVGAEVRGCLSIYNTLTTAVGSVPAGGVLIPPENGDATGIQPIATRQVVYVVQGGSLLIYDALDDALFDNPNNSHNPGQIFGLVGQFVDVKTIDF